MDPRKWVESVLKIATSWIPSVGTLELLEPVFRKLPRAFASLMGGVSRDYEQTAEACGVQPDEERLRAIREILATVQDEG